MTDLHIHETAGVVDYGPGPLPRNWRNVSGLDGLSDEERIPLGWHLCTGEQPAYDPAWQTISGPVAVLDEGVWRLEWTVTDRPAEELRAERMAEVDRLREEMMARGAPVYLSPELQFVAQTRDSRDFENVHGLTTGGVVKLTLGDGPALIFRDAANGEHELEPAQAIAMGAQVFGWRTAHYQAAWAHKAAIAALETAAEVAAYDVTADWPE